MGGTVQTSQSSTAPSNPDVNPTVSQLMRGLQSTYAGGVKVAPQSDYPGVSSTTKAGWQQMLGAADNPLYSGAIDSSMGELGDIAAGNRFGMDDPGFATLRQNAMDDAITGVGSAFTSSGRFGGGSYINDATKAAVNAIAPLDYANYQSDIGRQERAMAALPGLYQASLAPASVVGSVGSAMDADMLAQRMASNQLYEEQQNAPWTALERASGILAGNTAAAGTTSSTSVPWWQAALGGIGTAAGLFF